MTVGELIKELEKYPKDRRVLLYSHGRCGVAEQDEILGCYEQEIYDKDDNMIEEVISLYEY
jgi:hypothetical protein